METTRLDQTILRQFIGSEQFFRHGLVRNIVFTEGAKYVADAAGAYWLLDEIAFAQRSQKAVSAEEFQEWKLKVHHDKTATLTCEDGNYKPVFTKKLEMTTFPAEGITLWFMNNTIYLPSEH